MAATIEGAARADVTAELPMFRESEAEAMKESMMRGDEDVRRMANVRLGNETTFVKRFSPGQHAATLDAQLGSFAVPSCEATSGRLFTRSPLRDAEGKEHAPVPPAAQAAAPNTTLRSKDVVQTAARGRHQSTLR